VNEGKSESSKKTATKEEQEEKLAREMAMAVYSFV